MWYSRVGRVRLLWCKMKDPILGERILPSSSVDIQAVTSDYSHTSELVDEMQLWRTIQVVQQRVTVRIDQYTNPIKHTHLAAPAVPDTQVSCPLSLEPAAPAARNCPEHRSDGPDPATPHHHSQYS